MQSKPKFACICALVGCITLVRSSAAEAQAQAQAQPAAAPETGPTVYGDIRLRAEADQRSGEGVEPDEEQRSRPRLRARLGVDYKTPVHGLSANIRLATNPGTPGHSAHQTLSLVEENILDVDRAMLAYKPVDGLELRAGKMGSPLWQQDDVFLDEDIQPEGFALLTHADLGAAGTIYATGALFGLVNAGWTEAPFKNDSMAMWQARYAVVAGPVAPTLALAGAHMRDRGEVDNTDGTVRFRDTSFFMGSAQVELRDLPLKVQLGFDYHFSDAETDEDEALEEGHTTGFVAQLRLGLHSVPVGIRYYYYDVQEAAAPFFGLVTLTQDNFPNSQGGGLAGFVGHRAQVDYEIAKGVSTDFRAYFHEGKSENVLAFAEVPGRKINRFQLNFDVAF